MVLSRLVLEDVTRGSRFSRGEGNVPGVPTRKFYRTVGTVETGCLT